MKKNLQHNFCIKYIYEITCNKCNNKFRLRQNFSIKLEYNPKQEAQNNIDNF